MDKANTLKLLITIILALMYPTILESHYSPRPRPLPLMLPIPGPLTPLCQNQFELANRVCAVVQYKAGPMPRPKPRPDRDAPPPPEDDGEDAPPPPPEDKGAPPPAPAHGGNTLPPPRSRRGRGHRHHRPRHSHHHHRNATQLEAKCCRWLKEIDSVCVCNVLRHLPIFLSSPMHDYTVVVNKACTVSFPCDPLIVSPP